MVEVKKQSAGVHDQSSVGMIESEEEDKSPKQLQEKVSSIASREETTQGVIKSPKEAKEVKKNAGSELKRKVIHALHLHEFLVEKVTSNKVWKRKYPP